MDIIEAITQMNEERLVEMAIINPRMCKQSSIQVEIEQRSEGPVPHVHVYHDHTRNPRKCSYIRLDKPEYANFHPEYKNVDMGRKERSQFIKIMNSECPNVVMYDNDGNPHKCTGYQAACMIWADTYEDGRLDKFNLDENGLIRQLDYNKL